MRPPKRAASTSSTSAADPDLYVLAFGLIAPPGTTACNIRDLVYLKLAMGAVGASAPHAATHPQRGRANVRSEVFIVGNET